MVDVVDQMGLWWLPGSPQSKVPGRLTWDQDSGGELHLLGQLVPDEWDEKDLPDGSVQAVRRRRAGRGAQTYPVIHGQVGRKALTLLDCFSLKRREGMAGELTLEDIHVNHWLESSAWFDDGDDLRFDQATLSMRHLTSWINHSGIEAEYPRFDGTGEHFAIIRVETLPELAVASSDENLSFGQSLKGTGDGLHAIGIEQRWEITIAFDSVREIDAFTQTASHVQDLVSIAVGKTADFTRMSLKHPSVPLRSLSGEPVGNFRDEIHYRTRWTNRTAGDEASLMAHERFFSFNDFGGTDGVSRWLVIAKHFRTELGRVMATRYSTNMYLEDRIMNVCAALDSFDAVRRDAFDYSEHFVTRIQESISFAGETMSLLLPKDTDAWAETVRDARHDIAHHKSRFRESTLRIDHLLAEQLYWLFVLAMLRLASAPEEVYVSIVRHPQFRWLCDQVADREAATEA